MYPNSGFSQISQLENSSNGWHVTNLPICHIPCWLAPQTKGRSTTRHLKQEQRACMLLQIDIQFPAMTMTPAALRNRAHIAHDRRCSCPDGTPGSVFDSRGKQNRQKPYISRPDPCTFRSEFRAPHACPGAFSKSISNRDRLACHTQQGHENGRWAAKLVCKAQVRGSSLRQHLSYCRRS